MWLKNLPLKLTALALAVLLWFHVATNRTYDYARVVPLHPGPLPHGFALAAPLPATIDLLFTGTGKELLRFMWEDVSAQFLLEPRMSGAVPVSVDRLLVHADADVQVTQVVEPSLIDIFVDTIVTRKAAVRFQGEYGTTPEMALAQAPQIDPAEVKVHGPRSVVEELSTVSTQMLDLGTVAAETERPVGIDLSGAYNVSVDPATVDVFFKVVPRTRRTIDSVYIDLDKDWKAKPPFVALVVSGAEGIVASLEASDCHATAPEPKSKYETLQKVQASVPLLVELESIEPDSVEVSQR